MCSSFRTKSGLDPTDLFKKTHCKRNKMYCILVNESKHSVLPIEG